MPLLQFFRTIDRFLLFSSLLFFPGRVTAEFIMNDNCKRAYEKIIGLQFDSARELISREKNSNPGNDATVFLESKILFLTAFVTEKSSDFEKLKSWKDYAVHRFEAGDQENPYYAMAEAEVLIQTAAIKIKFREFISAALEIRKGYKLLEAGRKKFPDFHANLKAMGVLHALVGAVPESYQWVVRMVGMDGSIRQGIGELESLYQYTKNNREDTWLYEENLFLYLFLHHHLLKDEPAVNALIRAVDMKNAGPLIFFTVANFYNTTGQSAKTFELMDYYHDRKGIFKLPYLDFMHGSAHLFALDLSAKKYFQLYLDQFGGQNFIKAAHQKLAWISYLEGDTAGYYRYLQIIRKTGNDFADEDKQADREAELMELPNLYLLRSRLLFDGGYYQRSLAELAGRKIADFPHLKDQLELTYRMARIFDKTGQKVKAKSYYESTYANGQRQTWYFAANAALNLGLLYEEEGEASKAESYYRKCLALRNHEYQNSIDQKAKAGLNRLTKK